MCKYLKTTSVLSILFLSVLQSFSQDSLKQALQGEWIKDKISLKDGSPIYDQNVLNSGFSLEFLGDSLIISIDGRNTYSSYGIQDGILNYRGNYFKITRLEKPILELTQYLTGEEAEPIKLKLHYKPTYDLGLSPEYYLAKNGERVYIIKANEVEPKFINSRYSAIDYIYTNFRYPEFKKGGFAVRFVITKEGEITGQRILASSNPKYDQKLINAINKTEGKWLPAKYLGENVNCEVEYNFDLGWSKDTYNSSSEETDLITANDYEENGKYYFTAKNYRSAIYYFTKAIENNPYQLNSYYLRAAAHVYTKKISSACADYLQLKNLDQKRGADLYDKYCENYTPETKE